MTNEFSFFRAEGYVPGNDLLPALARPTPEFISPRGIVLGDDNIRANEDKPIVVYHHP